MYDFKEIENRIFEFWKKKKIIEKIRERNKGKKKFYFLDGPPYTSGRIHMGTAWNQVLKDEILRYKRMRGFDVWDRGGYDMHGLPTAHKVQEKYNLKDKKEIEEFGVEKFVKECKKFAIEMMQKMNKDFDRLAVSLDHVHPYMPITNEYIEGEWWLIKKAHEARRLYEGKKVMSWCSQCETALAKHELEYKNVQDKSIYVKFKVKGKDNEYLIIWTTTPWTIAYNLGVMVNQDIDYVKVKAGDEVWILAKELAPSIIENYTNFDLKILDEFKGKKLKGIEYIHPFYDSLKKKYDEIKKKAKNAFTVVLSKDFVDTSAGTGLVHMAPGCGPEDYEVGKKNNIPAFNNLTEHGNYPKDMGEFSGLNAKKDNDKFIEALEKRGALVATAKVEHEYPHCWRCKSPIIFRTTDQWFFKIEDLIPDMIKQSEKVKYIPKEIKERYQLRIKNLKDNSVTRQRYWGTPFPVWKCEKCGEIKVIGSLEELRKESITKIPKDFDLHRPWIDKIKLKCDKCGGEMTRVPDIIDVWVDSGVASWNSLYYPKEKKYFKKFWPADLILEATEQTRLWFYMLQLVSNIAFGKNCYKAMYTHGMLRDFQGVKMSKSLGNIISPNEVLDKYGVDTMRLYTITTRAGDDMNFSWEEIKLKYRELNVLINTANYLTNYFDKSPKTLPKKLKLEDKWILSRLYSTIKQATEQMDEYQLDSAPKLVEQLFLDLSRKYIQLTRDRNNEDEVFKIIFEVLFNVLKMFSITCPYISEELYQRLKQKYKLKEESIHELSWPKPNEKLIDKKLEKEFEEVFVIIERGLAARDKLGIGLKWPLAKVIIKGTNVKKEFYEIIKKQLNVKEIKLEKAKELEISFDTKLTPELKSEGYAREMSRLVQSFRKKLGLNKDEQIKLVILSDEELKSILKKQTDFIKSRTGSKSIKIVTTEKERFKNNLDFKIKDKRGKIAIIC